MAKKKNVTAFVVDSERVFAGEDGVTLPPLPGLWTNERAVLPEAIGLTLAEMRDLIDSLSLPLKEVKVSEGKAETSFPVMAGHLPSETGFEAFGRYALEHAHGTLADQVPEPVEEEFESVEEEEPEMVQGDARQVFEDALGEEE